MNGNLHGLISRSLFALSLLSLMLAIGLPNGLYAASDSPRRSLKICVAQNAAGEVQKAAAAVLSAVDHHPLLKILAEGTTPASVTDSGRLLTGPATERAYAHLVLVGLPDDALIQAAWQREARMIPGGFYIFGFGHLRGDIGYLESDRNPFLHGAAIAKAPFETQVITLTGSTPAGVELAVRAFLRQGLVNGVVAAPGFRRPDQALLDRDPLPPDFELPPWTPLHVGDLPRIGVTQASEDEYRGVLEDTGAVPRVIWRWKYHRRGSWDGAGAELAFDHYAAGLHRRAYGDTLWAAQFASAAEAAQAAPKIAAAAKLTRHGHLWEGEQSPYGFQKAVAGPLTLWTTGPWVIMSTLPRDLTAALAAKLAGL
jgi:hypothetical protein